MALGNRFRYVIAGLIFMSTLSIYVGRINLSTAIVEMAHPIESNKTKHIAQDVCDSTDVEEDNAQSSANSTADSRSDRADRYDWNESTQGIILGAFFWGYFMFQVPGGRMAESFGPRLLASVGIFGTGAINLATPFIVQWYYVFVASRVLLGALQAMVFPAAFSLTTQWIPMEERSTVLSLTSIGGAIGTIITAAMSGYLSKHGFAGGWPSVFYVSGIICIAVGFIYMFGVTNDPKDHVFVSPEEYDYIVEHIPALKARRDATTVVEDKKAKLPFPWLAVATSMPVIAAVCVKITITWSYNLVILKAPAYMEHVLMMPLEENGYFSSIIFVSFALSHLVGGIAADALIRRNLFRTKTPIRKIFEGIATFGTSACLLAIPFTGCNRAVFLTAMVASQATFGMQAGGEIPIPSDMTNEFTATLFAIENMFGMTTGFIGPYLTGMVLDMEPSLPKRQWSYIIYFTVAFNCLGGLIFCLFASAEPQKWGQSKQEQQQEAEQAAEGHHGKEIEGPGLGQFHGYRDATNGKGRIEKDLY